MKKLFALVLCLISVFIFVGCDNNPNNSSFTTHVSSENIWEYYYDYINVKENYDNIEKQKVLSLKDKSNISENDAQKYINTIHNRVFYENIIRDCIVCADVFENDERQVILDFDANITDYKISQVSNAKYLASYNQIMPRNMIMQGNERVDELIFNVPIKNTLEISITKSDNGIFNIKEAKQTMSFPTEIMAFEETFVDENGNNVVLKLEVEQILVTTPIEYTQTTLTASETVNGPNGVISSYSREAKHYYQNSNYYLQDTVKINDVIKSQQTFRLNNSYTNVAITYNKDIGYLSYDMTYNLNGKVQIFGEVYYQGAQQYLAKEFFKVIQGKPFNISQSFVNETNYKTDTYNSKTLYNAVVYVNIRNQEFNKFALPSDGDGSCVYVSVNENDTVDMQFNS